MFISCKTHLAVFMQKKKKSLMFFTDSYCDYIGVSFQRSVQSHLPVSAVHVGLEMGDLN